MPDPETLPAVADALCVSIDRLFDRKQESFRDLAYHLRAFLGGGSLRDLSRVACLASFGGDAAELSELVSIVKQDGFVISSNSESLPFLGIFEEPKAGWKPSLGNADASRRLFAALSKPGRLEAVCKLYEQGAVTFDALYAARFLGIDEETLGDLDLLGLFWKSMVEINGKETVLYRSKPSEGLFALLLLAAFLNKDGERYDFQSQDREAPLLR